MSRKKSKQTPKRVLRLPDLDFAKSAVLNTLRSPESKRSYRFAIDDLVAWYCSEPRSRSIQQWCFGTGSSWSRAAILFDNPSPPRGSATEKYLGCKQMLSTAVNDHIAIEPDD